ncbi:hypothetical protein WR25_06321 isoform B [Diploscapter pachys]|nr:hypothetical protein WR25_06321 isoform B [Diploscapter pachys]
MDERVPPLNSEEEAELDDAVHEMGFSKDLLNEIRDKKEQNPGMFVSAWEEDNTGIEAKNLEDPIETFLTAAEEGNGEKVRELLEFDPSLIKASDRDGYTALHRAAYNNHLPVVDYLLTHGADPEARTADGWTALMSAANWVNFEVIGRLLSHGVDPNARSNGNVTALHLAINSQTENAETVFHSVRYLLQAPGIDASVVSGSGDTPLSLARRSYEKVFLILSLYYVCRILACPVLYSEDTCYVLEKIAYFVIIEILINLFFFHRFTRSFSDDGVALCNDAETVENGDSESTTIPILNHRRKDAKFCMECNHEAPIRSHHCPLCKMCVLRKDHHCFVTGGCVGLGNQRYFLTFLFWCCVGLFLAVPIMWSYMNATVAPWYPLGFFYYAGPIALIRWVLGYSTFGSFCLASLFSFAIGGLCSALGFFGMNVFYTCYGYTMYEYHSAPIREAFDGDGNSLGERFRLVFGKNWLLNFIVPQIWNQPLLTQQIANNLFRDNTSIYNVKGIVILDQDGNRVIAKYYDKKMFGTVKEQKAFEKSMFQKTQRNTSAEILLLDGVTCLYRSNVDLYIYVLGSNRENELILESLLNCVYDSISTVLRKVVEKKALIDNMDTIILILDEVCDEGVVMETDVQAVVSRCALRGDEISLTDQSFSQNFEKKMDVSKSLQGRRQTRSKASANLSVGSMDTTHKSPENKSTRSSRRRPIPAENKKSGGSPQKLKKVAEKGDEEEKVEIESESGEEIEEFRDETLAKLTDSLETFFLQGTNVKMNKSSRKKGARMNKRAAEIAQNEDKEKENLPACDLQSLREFLATKENSKVHKKTLEDYTRLFPKWTVFLAKKFNLLLYGIGSKREILAQFYDYLSKYSAMQIDGSHPNANANALLTSINEFMKLKNPCNRRSLPDWAASIVRHIDSSHKQLLLFVHNIDAENFRSEVCQSVFSALGSKNAVRIIASVNHINAMSIWNTSQLSALNWIPVEVSTWQVSLKDIENCDSSFLGFDKRNNKMTHSLTSLDIFWKSLAVNSRSIFRLFFAMHFTNGQTNPVSFWDLFNAAKDEFLVSTDTALRTQLVEFKDHCIIRMSRSEDGSDILHGILDRQLVDDFLAEKGLNLDLDLKLMWLFPRSRLHRLIGLSQQQRALSAWLNKARADAEASLEMEKSKLDVEKLFIDKNVQNLLYSLTGLDIKNKV